MSRVAWLAELEEHWARFATAGWVETVTYLPYDAATDSVAATGPEVDAVGEPTRHKREEGVEDGLAYVERKSFHLRNSQLGDTRVTKRGVVLDAAGVRWVVESADYVADENEVACECVRG